MNTGLLSDTITALTAEKTGVIRVLVVDDHHVVREGLRRMLELESSIQVIGEARSGEEAIAKAISLSPDVIVMDLKMPEMDGMETCTAIIETYIALYQRSSNIGIVRSVA